MSKIGFTTGCLYRSDVSFDDRIKMYKNSGATAIELGFATPQELFDYQLSQEVRNDIRKFESVSIHAPWKQVQYKNDETTQNIFEALRTLAKKLPIEGFVVHPDTVENFDELERSGLQFLIENMDGRKSYGTHPEHFRDLKEKYDFGFVFDTQHAYEQDPSMQLAKDMLEVMGERLVHMHVSGHDIGEIHVPVHKAINKKAINKVLEMGIKVPKILEGILLKDIQKAMKKELTYVMAYEKK